jgi:hypothetical protein
MSTTISCQLDARRVWSRAALCYLCGEPLPILELDAPEFHRKSPDVNRDHVPPEKLFAPADRIDFPLLLRTHVRCNGGESQNDQKMAELFRSIWNSETEADFEALELEWLTDQDGRANSSFWKYDDLPAMVFRWIRGFHYALYNEILPINANRATLLPFLEIRPDGTSPSLDQYHDMASKIRRQRMTGQLDKITAYNGRLRYECAWFIDAGRPTCVYALDVNGWSIFSGDRAGPNRSGLGCYLTKVIPPGASQLSRLHFSRVDSSLDLFPDQRLPYLRMGQNQIRKQVSFRGGDCRFFMDHSP